MNNRWSVNFVALNIVVGVWVLIQAAGLGLAASTYYVATNGNDGAAGTGWDTALRTITNGVSKAAASGAGSVVILSNGVHRLDSQVSISVAIKVRGMTTNREQVIVDGNYPNVTNRCFYLGAAATIADLTVTNGHALTHSPAYGGGICANVGGGIISNCLIVGNVASNRGGGVYLNTGTLLINSKVIGNMVTNISSEAWGGGVCAFNGARVVGCLVSNNSIYSTQADGGGVYSLTSPIENCDILNNTSSSRGAGVRCGGGGVATNCLIRGNTGAGGGGVYLLDNGTVRNSLIIGNHCTGAGGGVFTWRGGNRMLDCEIVSNTAPSSYGGGIYLGTAFDNMISNCVITHNTGRYGGGIGITGSGLYWGGYIFNCLIAGNMATNNGGGLYVGSTTTGIVVNCTIAGNKATNYTGGAYLHGRSQLINCVVYSNQSVNYPGASENWTIIDAGTTLTNCCTAPTNSIQGSGNIAADPLFVGPVGGNYRVRGQSPCVNAGIYQAWMTGAMDLDGQPRIRYDRVDIGCYECLFQGTVFSTR